MSAKRWDVQALAYASAAVWGGWVLLVGFSNLAAPEYGQEFLILLTSIYPGYAAERSVDSVLILAGYALIHGAAMGWLFGWLHNRLVK